MRRRRNDDNYPATDESATKSASRRKIPQVCQFYSMFPICQTAKLKSLFTCLYYITPIRKKQYFSENLILFFSLLSLIWKSRERDLEKGEE